MQKCRIKSLCDNKIDNPLESVTTTLVALPKYNEDGKPQYGFYTNRCLVNGVEVPAKSPDGMFSEIFIPNDLAIVAKRNITSSMISTGGKWWFLLCKACII